MEDIFLRQCRESRYRNQRKSDGRGSRFSNPFIGFYEGRTYRQPEVVFISLPQAATGLCCACRARSVGGAFSQTCSCRRRHSSPEGRIPCRLLCTGHSYAEGVPADTIFFQGKGYLPEIKAGYGRKGETDHGDFSLYSKDCWTQQRKIHHIGICLSQWRCDEK